MAGAREFLDRFRPAGTPGAAAGVPADYAKEAAAELEPVLALLDGVRADCDRIVEAARTEAAHIARGGRVHAERITREGERSARATSDRIAGQALAEAAAQAREEAAAAHRKAAVAAELARRRMPELVARAVDLARSGNTGREPEGRATAWTEERRAPAGSDEGRGRLPRAPEASAGNAEPGGQP